MGDSAAAAPLVPNQADPAGCLKSTNDYPSVLARTIDAVSFRDVTCSGAKTPDLSSRAQTTRSGPVPPQLDALDEDTELVTVTIGGNDIDLPTDPDTHIWIIEADGAFAGYALSFLMNGERQVGYWIVRELWGRGHRVDGSRRGPRRDPRAPALGQHRLRQPRIAAGAAERRIRLRPHRTQPCPAPQRRGRRARVPARRRSSSAVQLLERRHLHAAGRLEARVERSPRGLGGRRPPARPRPRSIPRRRPRHPAPRTRCAPSAGRRARRRRARPRPGR